MKYLIILLVCVPLQFALIAYRKPAETYVFSLIHSWNRKITPWKDYLIRQVKENLRYYIQEPAEDEIISDDDEFLNSEILTVRSSRPAEILLRVGEVVVHTKLAYVGIVIGWQFKEGQEPVYEVLTDHPVVPDYKTKSFQKELIRLEHIQIYHGEATKYFEYYDQNKSQYVPKPWLRIIYPMD